MNDPVPATAAAHPIYEADLELAQAILARDRKATARFVDMHSDRVHAYVWRRLAPRAAMVDDIVQEVFLASWRGLKSYSGQAPLEAWILSIARFKVEDHYRQTLSKPLLELEDAPEIGAPIDLEGEFDSLRDAERAASILEELPYEYTLALRWRYWEGQSARSMAEASGRTEKAIERLLARAREQFRLRWIDLEKKGGGGQ